MSEVEEEEHLISAAENRQPSEVRMYTGVGADRRKYNMPHHEEVAAIFIGEIGPPPFASIGNSFHKITELGSNDISYLFSKR